MTPYCHLCNVRKKEARYTILAVSVILNFPDIQYLILFQLSIYKVKKNNNYAMKFITKFSAIIFLNP